MIANTAYNVVPFAPYLNISSFVLVTMPQDHTQKVPEQVDIKASLFGET